MANGYFPDDQLTTPLTEIVQTFGVFPPRDGGGSATDEYIGLLRTFAFNFVPGGQTANGQLLSINSDPALFSILGTIYGGNGTTTFALPNLQGVVPVGFSNTDLIGESYGNDQAQVAPPQFPPSLGGTSQAVGIGQPALAVTYLICTSGIFPSPGGGGTPGAFLGEVVPFLGDFAPDGFMVANGAVLSIASNTALFSLLGTTYGGDGKTTFALPNLTGRDIVGAGSGLPVGTVVGQSSVTLTKPDLPVADGGSGLPFNDQSPGLALNYIIAMMGVFPQRDGSGVLGDQPILGEVRAYAGPTSYIPGGWALANGQVMQISQDTALFSLLGTTYGGDGVHTFALPNLTGSVVSGAGVRSGTSYLDGASFGSDTTSLVVTNAVPCYCAGTLILTDRGERPVQDLRIGDTVVTASAEHRPIRWIGRRAYAGRFLAANPAAQPVRFHAGSLGAGLPRRDLLVSPEHAMALDGMLIPARCLLNGSTIVREHGLDRVDYFHVELDSHDVILAEGAPAESFLDDDSRGLFHNASECAKQPPQPTPAFYAPRVENGPALEKIRRRLAQIAA